ncbi:MAG: putative glutamine amidotransferase [Thermoleophilaceae bacterium]|nr:putative glutamine amidotransferase [Thermoleophilaceae bacterium]
MTGRRPIIGMAAAVEKVRWGAWDEIATLAPATYAAAVQRAGGMALVLPPDEAVTADPDEALDLVDGLLLAGGSDIDPASYGAEPSPDTETVYPARDRFEIALARRALARDMPVLGICRGMQLLNVAAGGTLVQHLGDYGTPHRPTPGTYGDHEVEVERGSLAARAVCADRCQVKSHHHQAVDRLGDGLVVSGRAAHDGLVEAVEAPARRFALGVLWHPEEDEESRVIGALVDEARAGAAREAA